MRDARPFHYGELKSHGKCEIRLVFSILYFIFLYRLQFKLM